MHKIWFVTGASRGLGFAVVQAALAAGHSVVATARNVECLKSRFDHAPESLLCLPLDITDYQQAQDAVKAALEHFGRIDVLVNNAGYGQLGWFENTTDAQIRRQFDVNVFGAMNVTRAVLPAMRAEQSGHVFTISSAAGISSVAGSSTYSSSKYAVEGWMEGLANELEPLGLHATIVAPGFFRTDFLDSESVSYAANDIPEYSSAIQAFNDFHAQMNHQQVGDPAKLGLALIQISEMSTPPLRYAAGSDSLGVVFDKAERMITQANSLAALSASTDGTAVQSQPEEKLGQGGEAASDKSGAGNVLIINAGTRFGASEGKLNDHYTDVAKGFFEANGYNVLVTRVTDVYDPEAEVQKILWADTIIYQMPAWWMGAPWTLKKYIDEVFTVGYGKIFDNDGRTRSDASRKYGSGGLLQGRKYMLSTTWNAPLEAFVEPGQFFDGKGVDPVYYALHKANEFVGLDPLPTFMSNDVIKQPEIEADTLRYEHHLKQVFL